ncbi:hypothetical protein M405DRAFT_878469 [Rhizopogon salebrosus TDB-379]|nr:hypothetical protein M405DRAFT_878469 [Rhizopogon salebrosus TDB-379]
MQIWATTDHNIITRIQDQNTYTLTNCKGGTVLDLCGSDNYSIIGFNHNSGANQQLRGSQWVFERADNFWFIKSAVPGSQKYLGIEGHISSAKNGTRVIAVSSPFGWDVEISDISGVQGIRISAHSTKFCVDLCGGDGTNLTKVRLWERWAGAMQIWAPTTGHKYNGLPQPQLIALNLCSNGFLGPPCVLYDLPTTATYAGHLPDLVLCISYDSNGVQIHPLNPACVRIPLRAMYWGPWMRILELAVGHSEHEGFGSVCDAVLLNWVQFTRST